MSNSRVRNLRLFIAVEIPESIQDGLERSILPLQNEFPKFGWVPPENRHVTVKFLGATEPHFLDELESRIDEVSGRHPPFELEIGFLMFFTPPRRPAMLMAEISDPEGGLVAVASDLEDALAPEVARERRKFKPHLTLARRWTGQRNTGVVLDRVPFTADTLTLFKSDLRSERPVYTRIAEFPLRY